MEPPALASSISWSNNWSISRPTIINLGQVQYRLCETSYNLEGFVLIECINLHEATTTWKPWRIFPAAYKTLLPRILHRLEIFCDVYDAIKDNKPYQRAHADAFKVLRLYIVHTERTLERIWEEVYNAAGARKMTSQWRSPTFNGWLLVEHDVRSHIIVPSEEFARSTGVSWPDLLKRDPLAYDWEAFDAQCPAWQRSVPEHLDSDEAVREVLAWCEPQVKKLVEHSDAIAASPNKRKSEAALKKNIKLEDISVKRPPSRQSSPKKL